MGETERREEDYQVLKRIISMEGTREDINKLEARSSKQQQKIEKYLPRASSQKSIFIKNFLSNLQNIAANQGVEYEPPDFGDLFSIAQKFYAQVLKRDQIFSEKILKEIEQNHLTYAALVVGGFHTVGFKQKLKEANMGYCVIAPYAVGDDGRRGYFAKMNDQGIIFKKAGRMLSPPLLDFLREIAAPSSEEVLRRMAVAMMQSYEASGRVLDYPFLRRWRKSAQTREDRRILEAAANFYRRWGLGGRTLPGAKREKELGRVGIKVLKSFDRYWKEFNKVTARAQGRFENRDWEGMVEDTEDRVHLYNKLLDRTAVKIRALLGDLYQDKDAWEFLKGIFYKRVLDRYEGDMALTFFYSVMRRMFLGDGVSIEYQDDGFKEESLVTKTAPVRHYEPSEREPRPTVEQIVRDLSFKARFSNLEGDVDWIV
ncbi:MAG: bifunctional isocitrate dehydrogenase kinase/phosphatase [Chlamydiae bacterium]|nr:bifunctional isocitrate dehydrogenase kinase/phosphatase [Chlamydiota bacterium]MBI3276955.1 bifunctional isocitrate dehydrogenase kinase/phosphatase [Chlamydiota bacterium]